MPTIHSQVRSGHEPAGIAQQEDGGTPIILRGAKLAQHILRRPVALPLREFLEQGLDHVRDDVARRDSIDADAVLTPLGRHVARQLDDGCFRGVVSGADETLWSRHPVVSSSLKIILALYAGKDRKKVSTYPIRNSSTHARNENHAPARPTFHHPLRNSLRGHEDARNIDLQHLIDLLLLILQRRLLPLNPRGTQQTIDPAPMLLRDAFHDLIQLLHVPHIDLLVRETGVEGVSCALRNGVELVGGRGEPVERVDGGAGFEQRFGLHQAETTRCAGHDDHFVAQTEFGEEGRVGVITADCAAGGCWGACADYACFRDVSFMTGRPGVLELEKRVGETTCGCKTWGRRRMLGGLEERGTYKSDGTATKLSVCVS